MKILQGVKNIVVQKNLKTDKFKRKKFTQKTRTKKERKSGTSMILYSKRKVFLHVHAGIKLHQIVKDWHGRNPSFTN